MASTVLPILPVPDEPNVPQKPAQIVEYSIQGFQEVHPRRNIVEWFESTKDEANDEDIKSWNLFLKALEIFQNRDEGHFKSYYQIAGVHGAPFVHWNEVPQPGDMPGNYCTHGSALFLPWHTPYQLLFEQELVREAEKYAESFSEKYRAQYVKVARTIRAPYWDWATDHRLPEPVRDPLCDILLPQPQKDDAPQPIQGHNPLYSYQFRDSKRQHRDFAVSNRAWREASQTLRCPVQSPNADLISQPDIADKQLGTNRPGGPDNRLPTNFRDGIFKLLMNVKTYGAFSNTGWRNSNNPKSNSQDFFSLESYHNSVHVFVGTDLTRPSPPLPPPGHMVDTASAAFDPIFWLHHGNVDRIYAMWQAINYQAAFQNQTVESTRLPDVPSLSSMDTAESELRPFYISDGPSKPNKLWITRMVQWEGGRQPPPPPIGWEYGYTYPEIPVSILDPEKLAVHVRAEAQRLYGPRDEGTFHEPKDYPAELSEYKDFVKLRRAWNVVFRVKRSLLANNFTIFFFLGDPGDDAYRWSAHKNLVGSFSTFKGQGDTCANCANQESADVYMKSGIDITEAVYTKLQETQSNRNLDATDDVVALLEKHLTWRLMDSEIAQGMDLETILSRDRQALKVMPTSFLVPYVKGTGRSLEDEYARVGEGLVLTKHEHYQNVAHAKRSIGGWEDDD